MTRKAKERNYRLTYTEDSQGYGEDNTSDPKSIEFVAKNDIEAGNIAFAKASKLLKDEHVWDRFDLEEQPRPARKVRWYPPKRKTR